MLKKGDKYDLFFVLKNGAEVWFPIVMVEDGSAEEMSKQFYNIVRPAGLANLRLVNGDSFVALTDVVAVYGKPSCFD